MAAIDDRAASRAFQAGRLPISGLRNECFGPQLAFLNETEQKTSESFVLCLGDRLSPCGTCCFRPVDRSPGSECKMEGSLLRGFHGESQTYAAELWAGFRSRLCLSFTTKVSQSRAGMTSFPFSPVCLSVVDGAASVFCYLFSFLELT